MPIYTNASNVIQTVDAQTDLGFVGDLVTTFDGTCSIGAPTKITSASTNFTLWSTIGQRITLAGAGASGTMYIGVITAIDSANQVTVSPSISTAVSNRGLQWGTDNTAAITALTTLVNTTNATFPGTKIVFGPSLTNSYGFPTRLVLRNNVSISGIGGGYTCDAGDYTRIGGTRLAWWGSSLDDGTDFGAFLEISPIGIQSLKRVFLGHCWLDCRNGDQNSALYGLKMASSQGFMIEDFFVCDASAVGMWFNVATSPTEAKDTTRFSIKDFCCRQIDNPVGAVITPFAMTTAVAMTNVGNQNLTVAANALPASGYIWTASNIGYPILIKYTSGGGTTTLTGCKISTEEAVNAPSTVATGNIVQAVPGNGCGILFDGGIGANTSCGLIESGQISHGTTWGPAAVELKNSDSNDFIRITISGGSVINDGAVNRIRKPGVRLNGSASSSTLSARNNTFRGGSAGSGGVSAMGVNNVGARLAGQSGPTYWDLYQLGNGEAIPVIEGNAYFDWTPNGAWRAGQRGAAAVADQAIAAATLTSIVGSLATVPSQGFQSGTQFRWTVSGVSAAVGTAANTIAVRIGTTGTSADAVVSTFTTGVGSAVIGEFIFNVDMTIRTIGATATAVASCRINASTTAGAVGGFIAQLVNVLNGTMSTFNTTTPNLFMHLTILTGLSKTLTIRQVITEVVNAANP